MAELQSWSKLLPTLIISAIYGGMTLVGLLIAIITKGRAQFFHKEERRNRPAVMDDPSLGEHKTVQLKNVKLHYVANGDPGKPLMLFLHGFPECWFSWRHQIRRFSDQYRTVAVDMRGYGESDKPYYVSDYSLDKLTADVAQLIKALGYEKCVLVAHDWGGAVANTLTQMHPEMVDRLILINIPHGMAFQQHLQKSFSQLRKSWYMFMFQWPYLAELLLASEDYKFAEKCFTERMRGTSRAPCTQEEVEAYKYSLAQPGGLTSPINYYRAALRYKPLAITASQITVPTLMIWGEQDMALEKKMAEMSADYFTEFTLKFIPTGSHWVLMDEPEQVNDYMANYLSGKKLE